MTPDTSELLLAAVEGLPPQGIDRGARHALQGVLPVIIAGLALVFVLVIWAVFFREGQGRRERGRILEGPAPGRSSERGSSRRRRRRREKQRPRNPTLAETGGLPPEREDQVPPPT